MKRVANSYSPGNVSALNYYAPSYLPVRAERIYWWIPRVPNYAWLVMIILTVSALSVSTLMRSRNQEREAQSSYSSVKARVDNARGVNQQIKDRTEKIRTDPKVAEQAAQDRLRLVRRNEVVVAVP